MKIQSLLLVFLSLFCALIVSGSGLSVSSQSRFPDVAQGFYHRVPLSLDQRVACQRVIEEVYWKHTLWPAENPGPKPDLSTAMPDSSLRDKVQQYLRKSDALADHCRQPITAQLLQAELERMARETADPGVLRELWSALHNDPYLIAECLAMPVLADRYML